MVTEEHAAGALDCSVDPEELTTLLAQENQDLLAQIEQLKRAARYCEQIDVTPDNQRETMLYDLALERDQLKAENADLQRDAERYQWLRDGSNTEAACMVSTYATGDLDSAIDQAMTKEQQA